VAWAGRRVGIVESLVLRGIVAAAASFMAIHDLTEKGEHSMRLLAQALFAIYRNILALFIYLGFKGQKVYELELPIDEKIGLIPYTSGKPVANIPKLHDVERFPQADRAEIATHQAD
jgi:hypothetical protein